MNIKTKENLALQIELNGYQVKGETLLKALLTQKLKPSVKMKLHRLADIVNKEAERHNEIRKELYLKYGVQDGEVITLLPENIDAYNKDYSELLDSEFDIDIKKIFGDISLDVFDTFEDEAYYPVFNKIMLETYE